MSHAPSLNPAVHNKTIKLAEYLFTRLRQLGVGAVHGVPGRLDDSFTW